MMRAWHVIMMNGADQTVVAQACNIWDGILTFSNLSRIDPNCCSVLVRAFAPGTWHDVDLVGIPDAGDFDTPAYMFERH